MGLVKGKERNEKKKSENAMNGSLGLTSTNVSGEEKPQCSLWMTIWLQIA